MTLTGRSGYPGLCARPALASRRPAPAARTRATVLVTLMAFLRVVLIQARCGGLVMQDHPFLPVPSPAYDRNGSIGSDWRRRLLNASVSLRDRMSMHAGNRLKLGLFGANCSSGRAATKVSGRRAGWRARN